MNTRSLRSAAVLVIPALIAAPAIARADAPPSSSSAAESDPSADPANAARAAELKKTGDDAMDSGRPADAVSAYTQAYALSKDPALLYNRGRALQGIAEYPQALEQLEAFEQQAPAALKARVPGLSKMLAEIRQRVSTVTITCDVKGATVRLRERMVGRCPFAAPIVVNAGAARIEVTADGYFPWEREAELPRGGTASFDVHLTSKERSGILIVRSTVSAASVRVDGERVGDTPTESFVLAGSHEIALSKPGYLPTQTTVLVAAGERREVDLGLEREPSILTRWWFWTSVGAVLAGGVVVGVALASEKSPEQGSVSPGLVRVGLSPAGFSF